MSTVSFTLPDDAKKIELADGFRSKFGEVEDEVGLPVYDDEGLIKHYTMQFWENVHRELKVKRAQATARSDNPIDTGLVSGS